MISSVDGPATCTLYIFWDYIFSNSDVSAVWLKFSTRLVICALSIFRLWRPEPHPESLFQTGVCPPDTDIAVERDLSTGELLGYHEVHTESSVGLGLQGGGCRSGATVRCL